jgi:uncharacterized protein YxjI
MKSFTVTQKILSIGSTYLVSPEGSKENAYVVKGKVLTIAPKLEMRRGDQGEVMKTMKGNFIGTKFSILGPGGSEEALIKFPFFSFIAKFTLAVGNASYTAKGGIMARKFSCVDDSGNVKFTISKEWSFRDKFAVSIDPSMPEEIAIMAAVAIDQRFFQRNA